MVARPANTGWLELNEKYHRALDEGLLENYRKRRWARAKEFAGWLAQDKLPDLSPDQALMLYRAAGGAQPGKFNANPLEEIRDVLDFLLYDTIKLEGRFDECAAEGGGFKLNGAGKEFVSYILCLQEPSLFAVWNSRAEGMLRRMAAFSSQMRTGPLGIRYLDMLEKLAQARYHLGLPDFRVLDELCFALASSRRRTSRV